MATFILVFVNIIVLIILIMLINNSFFKLKNKIINFFSKKKKGLSEWWNGLTDFFFFGDVFNFDDDQYKGKENKYKPYEDHAEKIWKGRKIKSRFDWGKK